MKLFEEHSAFDNLIADVHVCERCPRMCDSVRVLSWASGDPHSSLMFVGEAPGRLGADRTAIPFHGDKAGDNFEKLIELAGLKRSQIFVTNAVLCNPRDGEGNNAPPSNIEIENCAHFLRRQIEVIQPAMVMTLGSVALEATRMVERHNLILRDAVRSANRWFGRTLIPLYHPGARALIHRSFANQTADYYFVGEIYRRLLKKRSDGSKAVLGSAKEWDVVKYILKRSGEISNFRLHKLLYLSDVKGMAELGQRTTGFLYLRQKDGPYCVELGSRWYQRFSAQLALRKTDGKLAFEWKSDGLFDTATDCEISPQVATLIDNLIGSTANLSDSQLKTRAYLTEPMKKVLKAEKAGRVTLNRPLLSRPS